MKGQDWESKLSKRQINIGYINHWKQTNEDILPKEKNETLKRKGVKVFVRNTPHKGVKKTSAEAYNWPHLGKVVSKKCLKVVSINKKNKEQGKEKIKCIMVVYNNTRIQSWA